MAASVIYAISAIGTAIGGAAGATLVIYAVEIATVLYFAAALAVSSAYSGAQRRRAERQARDAYNASLQDRLIMVPLAGGQRSRIYGKVRNVEGVLFKATRGADNEFYTLVVSVAGHAVQGIDQVYFDDVPVELGVDGYVLTAPFAVSRRNAAEQGGATVEGANTATLAFVPVAGSVVVYVGGAGPDSPAGPVVGTVVGSTVSFTVPAGWAGTYQINYQHDTLDKKARVRKYLGGAAQDLSGVLLPLFPGLLTSADRFAGDACLIVDLQYDHDAFPTGVPNVSAVIRGANDVFDPRTGTTGYTENPALHARDWAYYAFGGNFPAGTVREADVIAAANACDVSTVFTTTSGTVTAPLYTCGIVCRTDQDPSQSFDEIVEAMAGRSGWSGGVMRMRAGVYRAPVATITEDWLSDADAITIVPEGPIDESVNIVRATIADAAQAYTVAPAPDVRADAYITVDGRELPQDVTYGGITDAVHAQHVSGVTLREGRSALTATLPCNLRAFPLELFDVVRVTLPRFGWSEKLFEVAEWRFSLGGGVNLTLRETGASIFDPAALFLRTDATPNTQLPNPFAVPPVTGLLLDTGLQRQADGNVIASLDVSWNPITDAAVVNGGRIEVRYAKAPVSAGAYTSLEVPGGDTVVRIPGVQDGALYVVTLRAKNALVNGPWCVQKWTVITRPADAGVSDLAIVNDTPGTVTVAGSNITKSGGSNTWGDAAVHSLEGLSGGAYVSARPGAAAMDAMFGLNSDPVADNDYTSIDYAWYVASAGNQLIGYASGASLGTLSTWAVGDVLSITYDGFKVRYRKNGEVLHEITAAITARLYLDTALYNIGAQLRSLRFGPLVSVSDIGTGQIAPGAATGITSDPHDFGGLVAGNGTVLQRSLTVTPPAACTIDFSATLIAVNCNADAASGI